MKNLKNNKGITLIALVITIIVLLILAGVSLSLVMGNQGILNKATNAVEEHNNAKIKEEVELAMAEIQMQYYQDKYVNGGEYEDGSAIGTFGEYASKKLEEGITTSSGATIKLNGTEITYTAKDGSTATGTFNKETGEVSIAGTKTEGSGETDEGQTTPTIPEGLQVGSTVTYSPSGTYNWQAEYASSDFTPVTDDVELSSASGGDFNITSWKVFSIDGNTVQLVPSTPTTGTVRLQGANGYNNAVKLLNDACSSLYGDTSKGITARSINIEDIESVLDFDPTTFVNSDVNVNYRQQYSSSYTTYKTYPAIYAEEIDSVITPTPEEKSKILGLSDAGSDWVTGTATAGTSIQPYQTYYYLNNSNFSSKLNDGYSELLLPSGNSTNYWVASHCVYLASSYCGFYVRTMNSGSLGANYVFSSSGGTYSVAHPLFPVVSLADSLIETNDSGEFIVK